MQGGGNPVWAHVRLQNPQCCARADAITAEGACHGTCLRAAAALQISLSRYTNPLPLMALTLCTDNFLHSDPVKLSP